MPNLAGAEVLGRHQVQTEWVPETGVPVWQHSGKVSNGFCGEGGKVLKAQATKDLVWR